MSNIFIDSLKLLLFAVSLTHKVIYDILQLQVANLCKIFHNILTFDKACLKYLRGHIRITRRKRYMIKRQKAKILNCLNHANKSAEYHCVGCDDYFCYDCINDKQVDWTTIYVCSNCKDRCEKLEDLEKIEVEQEEITYARDFWVQLKSIFKYPFKGKGPASLFKGTICLTIGTFPVYCVLITQNFMTKAIAIASAPVILIFTIGFFLRILEGIAVSEEEELPDLPNLLAIEDWLRNTLYFILVFGLCMVPVIVYVNYTSNYGFFFKLLFSTGLFFIPIYMLYASLGVKLSSMDPIKAVLSILNNLTAYSAIFFLWLILIFIGNLIWQSITVERFFIFVPIIKCFLVLYLMFVGLRPLGVFYRAYEDRLVGFDNDNA